MPHHNGASGGGSALKDSLDRASHSLALAAQFIVAETVFGLGYSFMFEGRFRLPRRDRRNVPARQRLFRCRTIQ